MAAIRVFIALEARLGRGYLYFMYYSSVLTCVEINQCFGASSSSGEEPASPRHRAGGASMAWRLRTRRISSTNAP